MKNVGGHSSSDTQGLENKRYWKYKWNIHQKTAIWLVVKVNTDTKNVTRCYNKSCYKRCTQGKEGKRETYNMKDKGLNKKKMTWMIPLMFEREIQILWLLSNWGSPKWRTKPWQSGCRLWMKEWWGAEEPFKGHGNAGIGTHHPESSNDNILLVQKDSFSFVNAF